MGNNNVVMFMFVLTRVYQENQFYLYWVSLHHGPSIFLHRFSSPNLFLCRHGPINIYIKPYLLQVFALKKIILKIKGKENKIPSTGMSKRRERSARIVCLVYEGKGRRASEREGGGAVTSRGRCKTDAVGT